MSDSPQEKLILETVDTVITEHPNIFMLAQCDAARINVMLDKLREVWERNPDLRLAQLVVNATGASQPCPEIFFLEDEVLLRCLAAFNAITAQAEAINTQKNNQ